MEDTPTPLEDDQNDHTPLDNLLAELHSWITLTGVEDDHHTSRWARAGARDSVVKALAIYDYTSEHPPFDDDEGRQRAQAQAHARDVSRRYQNFIRRLAVALAMAYNVDEVDHELLTDAAVDLMITRVAKLVEGR